MAEDTTSPYKREIGQRLRDTREALGYPKRPPFLRDVYGLPPDADVRAERDNLEKWETGTQPSAPFLKQLKSWRGITFEWIFDGDMSKLPQDVYNALIAYYKKAG